MKIIALFAVLVLSSSCAHLDRHPFAYGYAAGVASEALAHALEGARNPDKYRGGNLELAAIFHDVANRRVDSLRARGFVRAMGVLDGCSAAGNEVRMRTRILPTTAGFAVRVHAACVRSDTSIVGVSESAITDHDTVIVPDPALADAALQASDPDLGLDAEDIAERYRGMLEFGTWHVQVPTDDPPYSELAPIVVPWDLERVVLRSAIAILAVCTTNGVDIERDGQLTRVHIAQDAPVGFTRPDAYAYGTVDLSEHRAYAALAYRIDRWYGDENGITTPFELAQYLSDLPALFAIANGTVTDGSPDVIPSREVGREDARTLVGYTALARIQSHLWVDVWGRPLWMD